jgi:hypothetical protein
MRAEIALRTLNWKSVLRGVPPTQCSRDQLKLSAIDLNGCSIRSRNGRARCRPSANSFSNFPDVLCWWRPRRQIRHCFVETTARSRSAQVVKGATVVVVRAAPIAVFLCARIGTQCVAPPHRGIASGALRGADVRIRCNETRALTLLANSAAVAIANAHLVERQKQQAEQAAIAAERDRLAVELHDNLAQTLSFLNLKSDRVRDMLGDREIAQASDELAQMKAAIGTAYHQVRTALTGLREPPPDADNLRARLSDCVAELNASGRLSVELNIRDASALALPRVTQLRLTICESCRMSTCSSTAYFGNGEPHQHGLLVIEDDGGALSVSVDGRQHLGLNIMRTRRACGGRCRDSSGAGTRVARCCRYRKDRGVDDTRTDSVVR